MSLGFKIPEEDGSLDLLSLGALVHRLDPGIIPFRKATNVCGPCERRRVQRCGESVGLLRSAHRHCDGDGGLSDWRPDRTSACARWA